MSEMSELVALALLVGRKVVGAVGHPAALDLLLDDGFTLTIWDSGDYHDRTYSHEPTNYDVPWLTRVPLEEYREMRREHNFGREAGLYAWVLDLHRRHPTWSDRMALAHLEAYRAGVMDRTNSPQVLAAHARQWR